MDQRTGFSSDFLSLNFQSIVESASDSAHEYGFSENFQRVIKKPFCAGLAAGDNATIKGLLFADLEDVAYNFGYEPSGLAEYESFTLGFYISCLENVVHAVKTFIDTEEDFERIAEYRNSVGESVTADELGSDGFPIGLVDALILVNSFVED